MARLEKSLETAQLSSDISAEMSANPEEDNLTKYHPSSGDVINGRNHHLMHKLAELQS
jgi:hypothetical protein